ncbi:MAG TPA: CHAT domain-containing tetratricopeptide repeat protein [Bryobacteraceae bacterium]|nr:CHAT domain-containing tetratricopeptide repeat protein [Bryobacteraceae bacterium]
MALRAEEVSEFAARKGHLRQAAVFDNLACRAWHAQFHYGKALRAGVRGRQRAVQTRHWAAAAYNAHCVTRVYYDLSSYRPAVESAAEMLEYTARVRPAPGVPEMRLLAGNVLVRAGRIPQGLREYEAALAAAPKGNYSLISLIEDQIGMLRMNDGDGVDAEAHLLKAFQIRKAHAPASVGWSYNSLGLLALAKGDPAKALPLFNNLIDALPTGMWPTLPHFGRMRAHYALGQFREALADARQALALSRALRLHHPFGDEMQIGAEGAIQNFFSLYVDLAASLQEPEEAFLAAQENRAASLRTRTAADEAWRSRLPEAYWEKLTETRQQEMLYIRSGGRNSPENLRRLRLQLAEMESSAGPEAVAVPSSMKRLRSALEPGETLIGFHLGDRQSWRWEVDAREVTMSVLPPRRMIAGLVQAFRESVEQSRPDHIELGLKLYNVLFSKTNPSPKLWTVVPDETLFALPFSALVTSVAAAKPVYLAQLRAIRLTPTAFFFSVASAPSGGHLLAVGDPISNRADPRWKPDWSRRLPSEPGPMELARLSGTEVEMDRCQRILGGKSLRGADITMEALRTELSAKPRILHWATHIYQSPGADLSPVISLGMSRRGEIEVLTDADIAVLPYVPPLVTLSGCGSGRGRLAPGTGLLGLTRAWLMAGSQAVTATLWPVLDDDGYFFQAYYEFLQGKPADSPAREAAYALQRAQIEIIQQKTVRSRPTTWAAYFVIGAI